jgi:pilus assembly protein CpaB
MNIRAFWMLGLALILAGGSVFLARNWLQSQIKPAIVEQMPAPQIEMSKVVVAATPLFFGNEIRAPNLREADWPEDAVPPGAFNSIDEILGDGSEKRVVLRAIEINEPLLRRKISGFGGRATLSAVIAPEMRASTIGMSLDRGVAGFVLPGDHVDIMLTRKPTGGDAGGGGNLITDVLLQNVKVLGINQNANDAENKPQVPSAVTFEVTTIQAQKLVLAQRLGSLSLALRHVTNVAPEIPKTVSLKDLKVGEANLSPGEVKAPPKTVIVKKTPKKKKEGLSVRIVRGLSSSKYEVQPERKPLFSTPADSKPLELTPQTASTPSGTTSTAQPGSSPVAKSVSAPLSLLQPADENSTEVEAVSE